MVLAIVGVAATVGVALVALDVSSHLMPTAPGRPTDLRLFLRQAGVVSWLIGVVLLNLVALPLDNPFGPLATATSGRFILVAMGLAGRRFAHLSLNSDRGNADRIAGLLILTVGLLLVERLLFRAGLPL